MKFNPSYYPKDLEEFERLYKPLHVLAISRLPENFKGWCCYPNLNGEYWIAEHVLGAHHIRHKDDGPAVFLFDRSKKNSLYKIRYFFNDDFLFELPGDDFETIGIGRNILYKETLNFIEKLQ